MILYNLRLHKITRTDGWRQVIGKTKQTFYTITVRCW